MSDGTVIKGTEVKWLQLDRPLKPGETFHGGLAFKLPELISGVNSAGLNVTVQGYWTVTVPKLACIEAVNPHGKNVPPAGNTTLPGSKGGQNEDGFYRLLVKCVDPETAKGIAIEVGYVSDGAFVPVGGPYPNDTVVKITEAPGAAPSAKKIGSTKGQAKAVIEHITLPSDPVVMAVLPDGTILRTKCFVPPPPK